MKIPCDTLARLSHVLPSSEQEIEAVFRTFRLDNGKVIVSNRRFMAVESVEPFEGVFHIAATEQLVEQVRTEAQFSSVIDFTPIEALRYTTAITSMDFKISENIGVWPEAPTDFDRWREIIEPCNTPLEASSGPLVVDVHELQALALSSPSGRIVFEPYFAPESRPAVVRDADSADWVGFFRARMDDGVHRTGATVPGWCK